MSQITMPAAGYAYASPLNCTHADLALIVANASFLWERLDLEHFTADNEQSPEIARRLNHWCQVIAKGNWDTMQKRLQWEGLDLDTVRPWLGMQFTTTQPLPEWAETLRQIIQTAAEFTPASESFLPTEPENPIPFEEILLPAIAVAKQQLLTRLGSLQLTQDTLSLSITQAAYQALERSLLQRLAGLCTKTLDFEFS